jgi:ubiquinone/menaquinone biosynthesis C-methylase UbiE
VPVTDLVVWGRNEATVPKDDIVVRAFTELAPDYEHVVDSELTTFWGWGYEEFVARLIELADISAGERVLDVATGTALIPRKLVDGGAAGEIVGLDITLGMLRHAQQNLGPGGRYSDIRLVCASAMDMPFARGMFDRVTCALATHHMDVPLLLSEVRRVLRVGGGINLAVVAASPRWKLPGVKGLLRVATWFYFLPIRGIARAWAESSAVSNVRTADEWESLLLALGFADIEMSELPRKHVWIPAPLVICATKT